MHEEILKECGLTNNESLVYLALLRIGKAKSGKIVKESKISSGKIYETLNKLIDKGLIKTFIENGIKVFLANNPQMLIEYLKDKEKALQEKEQALEKLLPQFTNMGKNIIVDESVELMKGLRALREAVYPNLYSAKEIRIMGVSSRKEVKYNTFWSGWHRERVDLKKKARVLFSDRDTEYWDFFKKLSYTQTKSILHFSPSALMIIDEEVFIFSYESDLTCIHIKSKSVSLSFSGFFDDLWKIAEF